MLTESIQRWDVIGGLHEIRLRHREQRHHNIFIGVELGDSERRLKSVDQYRGLLIVRRLNYFALRGKLIGDVPTATAILDRLLERAEVIQIIGNSYRLKDKACHKKGDRAKERE